MFFNSRFEPRPFHFPCYSFVVIDLIPPPPPQHAPRERAFRSPVTYSRNSLGWALAAQWLDGNQRETINAQYADGFISRRHLRNSCRARIYSQIACAISDLPPASPWMAWPLPHVAFLAAAQLQIKFCRSSSFTSGPVTAPYKTN